MLTWFEFDLLFNFVCDGNILPHLEPLWKVPILNLFKDATLWFGKNYCDCLHSFIRCPGQLYIQKQVYVTVKGNEKTRLHLFTVFTIRLLLYFTLTKQQPLDIWD